MSPYLTHVLFNIAKNHQPFLYQPRILTKSTTINVSTFIFSYLSSKFIDALFCLFHEFWFYVDDINHCVGGTKHKYVINKLTILYIWPMQKGINVSQVEVKSFEEKGFFLNKR
jgi:hypothetical protein